MKEQGIKCVNTQDNVQLDTYDVVVLMSMLKVQQFPCVIHAHCTAHISTSREGDDHIRMNTRAVAHPHAFMVVAIVTHTATRSVPTPTLQLHYFL